MRIENEDILQELGTHDYLNCILEDTTAQEKSPVRYCSMFITYYTGNPDTVPHVPDECYVGGGNKQEAKEYVDLAITNRLTEDSDLQIDQEPEVDTTNIKVSRIVFSKAGSDVWSGTSNFSRLYFFKVNGEYASTKDDTRAKMAKNIFGKYSYFSKVEWQFYGVNSQPSREEMIDASSKMLSDVVPVLEREHWPDWKAPTKKKENSK